MTTRTSCLWTLVWLAPVAWAGAADWPALHGNARHTGYTPETPRPPWRLAWVRHFSGERLGTAMEPIVAGHRVFAATHSGNVYALDATEGRTRWRFQTHGACLQSPAYEDGRVVVGSTDGNLYALDAETGKLGWSLYAGRGGFSAAPVIAENTVFIGTRAGDFLAVALESGKPLWRQPLGAPIRQTAAVAGGRVFVTSEDMRVHCRDSASGRAGWSSDPLTGQTVRDYYPIIVETQRRLLVIVRSNPIRNMGQHIGRDRTMLCRNAGVDDSGLQKVDAWIKSPEARGTPELWEQEQRAIIRHLEERRDARTFFVLDAATGQEAVTAPVLWVAGCQAVGAMPAQAADGRLLVFYRSAYGNWNHGVAPLVALGLLDLETNRIAPLEHPRGRQPPWNTFWGTADESQSFTMAGDTVLIAHQGTLSGFSLKTRELFTIWGERDTYGGLRSPPWARNEWHGPGRGSVAVSGNRLYWITGSRILCLVAGERGDPAEDLAIDGAAVPTEQTPPPRALTQRRLREALNTGVAELLSQTWAPLFVEPGLAGRDFSFDHSGDTFEALAWAWPHLDDRLKEQARSFLAREWTTHPPFTKDAWYPLQRGARREFFWTPDEVWERAAQDQPHHPFGNVHAVWLHAERCDEWPRVLQAWPQIKESYDAFGKTGWRLDGAQGDLFANRYLASLLALARIAEKAGDPETARRATAHAEQTAEALAAWWKRAATSGTLTTFKGSGELDPFLGKGDGISFRVAPHRHKVALFRNLTPEVAALMRGKAPGAVAQVWMTFETLYRTWHLTGEERQVHFGENFIDPPDLALGGFQALAWLKAASAEDLARRLDLPFCRADLFHLVKLALCLETTQAPEGERGRSSS
ncbi:MAG: PQQ-binding-like beta-propeller repeat protein [Verrucomicrobia bacterium]|nr:PQQ-binding-like beta-propeller repeat protein [Verrucomicrobiota bacterium]